MKYICKYEKKRTQSQKNERHLTFPNVIIYGMDKTCRRKCHYS